MKLSKTPLPERKEKSGEGQSVERVDLDSKTREAAAYSNVYDYLRCLRLQILGYLIAWREPTERQKVAIYNRHWSALYHVMLHMVPLSGAMVLLILNWSSFFIGSDFSSAIWLQFVAKFHELLMQTSIVEVVLAIIRQQLINGYLPLGALSAATQSYHISYLWSLDFLSSFTSQEIPSSRKVIFATLIPLLVMLTAVVGPSTATLMIPRSNMPQLVTVYKQSLISTKEATFPRQINLTSEAKVNLDSFAWTTERDSITAGYPKSKYVLPGDETNRYEKTVYNSDLSNSPRKIRISIGYRKGFEPDLQGNATFFSATASMPAQFVVKSMRLLYSEQARNASISVDIPHPVVTTKCTLPVFSIGPETKVSYIQDDGKSQATLFTANNFLETLLRQNATNLMSRSLPPIWSPSPEPNSSALIGAFFTPWQNGTDFCQYTSYSSYPAANMFSDGYRQATQECYQLITCNVQAFWKLSTNDILYSDQTPVAQTPLVIDAGFDRIHHGTPITMDLSSMTSFNNGSFTNLLAFQNNNPVEPILASIFVNTLANAPDMDFYLGVLEGSYYPLFDFKLIQYGYGYDTSPISVRLSMVVITLYCLVTVIYILYILTVGYTSTSWNTAIELILLALQSEMPEGLKNVSAGADSMITFQKTVGVRVNKKNELALVFPNEPDTRLGRVRRVVPNKVY